MGHASHVLCMAISSDGKYLVWGQGLERWPWECSPRVLGVESHAQMCLTGLKKPLPPAGTLKAHPKSGNGGRGGLWVSKVQVSGPLLSARLQETGTS